MSNAQFCCLSETNKVYDFMDDPSQWSFYEKNGKEFIPHFQLKLLENFIMNFMFISETEV